MIRISSEQLKTARKDLRSISSEVPKVLARALNRAIQSARTEFARQTRQEYHIKHSDILQAMKIRRARADQRSISTSIKVRGTRRELMQFRVLPKNASDKRPKVLKVAVKKNGTKALPGAFVALGRSSGKQHVLMRVGRSRYPINIKYGPSIPEMAGNEKIAQLVEGRAREVFDVRLQHEMSRVLGRVGLK